MKYDVFISYAHSDAKTEEGKAMIKLIKNSIEAALQSVSDSPFVFLDSDALKWGEEWESKIRESIANCSVFMFLLSPNYLRSDYCHRERLWWEYQEIQTGRLNKGTRPVYYVLLNNNDNPLVKQYIEESWLLQTDESQPFFESLDKISFDLVKDRIRTITEGICKLVENNKASKLSICSVYPGVSKYFVGRIEELMRINAKTFERGRIPVVSGGAGVGKTELAVAYAYAYAESFPQGRFMIPMQGITSWEEAMTKLVEWYVICCKTDPEDIGLPEGFNKLPPENKKEVVFRMLKKRAENGSLLILLDNLDDLSLISDSRLRELTGPAGLPANLHMIATTRLEEKDSSSLNVKTLIEVGKLKEKDALEMFCKMGDNVFPFAKYPLVDGKLLLDFVPEADRPSKEKEKMIEQDYVALKDIILELDSHAWSLEIVAGRLAASAKSRNDTDDFGEHDIRNELKSLKNDLLSNLKGKTIRSDREETAEILLAPTFERIQNQNEQVGGGFGVKIMRLAVLAAFFPPEQIPVYALKELWKQEFNDDEIKFEEAGYHLTGSALDYSLMQLKKYRIISGNGPQLKMHRLTREVLQNRLSEEEKLKTVKTMQAFLETILSYDSEAPVKSSMLLPWSGWAGEWGNKLKELQKDEAFLDTLGDVARRYEEIDFYDEAKSLHKLRIGFARKNGSKRIIAESLGAIAGLEEEIMHLDNAIQLYAEAVNTQNSLIEEKRGTKEWGGYVISLKQWLHTIQHIYESHKMAEKKYPELIDLVQKLDRKYVLDYELKLKQKQPTPYKEFSLKQAKKKEKEIETLKEKKKKTTSDIDNLFFCLRFCGFDYKEADCYDKASMYLYEALELGQDLAKKDPEKYEKDLADIWKCLAKLDENAGDYRNALKKHLSALNYVRKCRNRNQEKYNSDYSDALYNLANTEKTLAESLNWPESREHYESAMKWLGEEYVLQKDRLDENQDDIAREDLMQDMDFTLGFLADIEEKIGDNLNWPESREHYENAVKWYGEEYDLLQKSLEEKLDESAREDLMQDMDFTLGFLADIEEKIGDFLLAELNAGQSSLTQAETPECVGHYNNALDWYGERINLYQRVVKENIEDYIAPYRNAVDQYSNIIDRFAKANLLDEHFYAEQQAIIKGLYQDVISLFEEKHDLQQKHLEEKQDESKRKKLIMDLSSTMRSLADLEEKFAGFLLDEFDDSEQTSSTADEWQECVDHLDNIVNWHQRIVELYQQAVKENLEEYIAHYKTAVDCYSEMSDRLAEQLKERMDSAELRGEIKDMYQDVLTQYLELEQKNPEEYAFDVCAIMYRIANIYADSAENNDDNNDAKNAEELLSFALNKLYTVNTDHPENASRRKRLLPFLLRLHASILVKLDPYLEKADIEIKETEQALELFNDLLKDNPDNETLLEHKASCLHNLSVLHRSFGLFDKAQEEGLEELEIQQRLKKQK